MWETPYEKREECTYATINMDPDLEDLLPAGVRVVWREPRDYLWSVVLERPWRVEMLPCGTQRMT